MRWEKLGDFQELLKVRSSLVIPGERAHRFQNLLLGKPNHVPSFGYGIESFLLLLFTELKVLEIRREEHRLLFELVQQVLLTLAHKDAKVEQKNLDQILYYFWQYQRIYDPAAIRPQSESVDEMAKTMHQLRALFDQSSGIAVKPADALSKVRR